MFKICFGFISFLWLLFPILNANEVKKAPRVLILQSYHTGMVWTSDMDKGFITTIKDAFPKAIIHTEYMDTKRTHDDQYKQLLYDVYKHKYTDKKIKFDLILCSDNNALVFLVDYRDELFGKIPVVFCGVNSFNPSILKGKSLFTGVGETPLVIKETIDIALALQPDLKHVYSYNVLTPTYLANRDALNSYMPEYADRLKFHLEEKKRITEVREHIKTLPPDSMVIVIGSMEEDNGERINLEDFPARILDVCPVPMYSCWDYFIGPGCIGGKVITGFSQAKAAAEIGVRILKGESIESIPPQPDGPRVYKFDYPRLKQFGIDLDRLPKDTIIINQPNDLYKKYIHWLIGSFIAILVLLGFIGVLSLNIHNRKHAEIKLRSSEEKFSKVFQMTPEWLLIIKSSNFKCVDANEIFFNETGFQRESIINKSVGELPVWESHSEWNELYEKRTNGVLLNYELSCKNEGGDKLATLWSVVSIEVENEEFLLAVVRNVTELEQLKSQLDQAKRLEAIGTLAGGVAHDFNNLLQVVLCNTELVISSISEKDVNYKILDHVKDASLKGTKLIEQLLALGSKKQGVPKLLDLNQEIDGMVKLLRHTIPEMTKIQVRKDATLPQIFIDPVHVGQVLMNLTVNANHAMPDGGEITISTNVVELDEDFCRTCAFLNPGKFVRLCVSDTGTGISLEDQQRIFDPFFTTKELTKGTGLGLATVFNIVKSCHGHITCYSELGEGTKFTIYFPVASEHIVDSEEVTLNNKAMGGTESILLIDDDDRIREVAKQILSDCGYSVELADCAQKGLDIYKRQGAFDLVLLDLIMPGMRGRSCLKELLDIDPKASVIVVSGFDPDCSINESLKLGAKGFIAKPWQRKELLQKIRQVLDR